ncbi:MAG: hypothetical protein ABSB78_07595 [Bacteroidota bacterium]
MKWVNACLILLAIGTVIFFIGCKKGGESSPVSYVDGYTVDLTEGKGTTYTGDFFPIREGYTCNYSGSASIYVKMVIPGNNPIENTSNTPAVGMLKVLALRNIPLPSGTIPLYPIVDMTDMSGQVVNDTSRFFMKDTQAVYVKALRLSSGEYMEVSNPLYIKSRLVVGDSWETAPTLDMTKLIASETGSISNVSLDARAKFFVVGKENISLPIGTRNAMRMEQANDISMTGTIISEGTTIDMNMTAQLATVYHLIADTGIVHQNTTGPLEMKLTAEGQTVTVTININQSELKLTGLGENLNANIYSGLGKSIISNGLPSFNTHTQERLWKISQAIARTLTKNLSL